AEIEKVKKRREERAIEKAQHEEEMALLARERARAEFQDWEKKEEEFHFDQSKFRSEIRVREGRTKPIDILSKQLNPSDDFDIEINEPYMVFKGLTVREMEELREDIKMHLDLDRATPTHIQYWEALLMVCDWELAEARKRDALDRARVRGEQPPAELLADERGLHSSIEADVRNLLQGKSYSELEVLQSQIESQMRSGTAKVVEYWEVVLKRLHIYKAKACLREIHTKMLRKHLERLEQPLVGEDNLEPEQSLSPQKEEDNNHDEDEAFLPSGESSDVNKFGFWIFFKYLTPKLSIVEARFPLKVLSYVVNQWALLMVCDWELAEARKRDALDRARVRGEQPPAELLADERGLHSSIEADVRNLLQGKSYSELEVLQSQIESQMRSGTAKVVEYWEVVLKRLHIYKAKACLREIHTKMLRKHLERLEQPLVGEDNLEPEQSLSPQKEEDNNHDEDDAQALSPEPMLDEEIQEAAEEAGSYSPQLLHGHENEEAIDPEEDRAILELKRKAVLEEQQRRIQEAMASRPAPQDNLEMKAIKAMGAMEEGDAVFGSGDEVNLDSQVYWWHDKYRPRKPKYFNRVHTGYEWNKYNQTHYDHDNPPPKVVQGYKFNIFYPDLVDKIKAPTYTIEKDGDSGETCIIRFHAGPPYEDIAFKIVNKEWEYSHKKGFKCTFERGILHVYFNFKRYRYRR
ncbi:Cactin like, partial [Actinidia chinensis var. chinensis]